MSDLQARLQTSVDQVARLRDPYLAQQGLWYVRQYLRQELGQWGTVTSQEFTIRGQQYENLILSLPGLADRPPILIGAHYDAVPNSPGADDNASGVAVLLELARHLSQQPGAYPLRLVAFDLEETSYEQAGSTFYAHSLRGEPLRLMLSLEMLGYCDPTPGAQKYPPPLQYLYPDRGDFIALIGNFSTLPDLWHFTRQIRRTGLPCQGLPAGRRGLMLPDTRRSDHAVFWDLGYRALMVTDTSFLRNPHYHQSSDRPQTLDWSFLMAVYRGLVAAITCLK